MAFEVRPVSPRPSPAEIVSAAMVRMQVLIQGCDDRTQAAMRASGRLMTASDTSIGRTDGLIEQSRRSIGSAHLSLGR